jgi:hypothetical protein
VPNTSSRIEVCTIFFETNIMSNLLCILCATLSIKLIAIYFHVFEIFNIQVGEMAFCAHKGDYFFDDFEALVREI